MATPRRRTTKRTSARRPTTRRRTTTRRTTTRRTTTRRRRTKLSTTLGRAFALLLIAGSAYVYRTYGWPWLVAIGLVLLVLWVIWFLISRRREIYAEYHEQRGTEG